MPAHWARTLLPLLLPACASTPVHPVPELPAAATVALSAPCPVSPAVVGHLRDVELDEVSGIVESWRVPGVFFVNNDSGDSPRFFAIDRSGVELAEIVLDGVPIVIDAEDIALGPAPHGGSYVYLGDTGNNFASMGLGIPRRKAVLYRVSEPTISRSSRHARLLLSDVFPIVLTFPDGARDVEAFFVDPVSGELVMVSKQPNGHSQILTASAAQLAGGGGELRLAGELRFGRGALPGSTMPTAADISRDGSTILLRTYSSLFRFRRQPGEPAAAALLRAPESLPCPDEKQGEAVGFAEQDSAFIAISEGVKGPVYCAKLPSGRNNNPN
jgi:hypothetical protein